MTFKVPFILKNFPVYFPTWCNVKFISVGIKGRNLTLEQPQSGLAAGTIFLGCALYHWPAAVKIVTATETNSTEKKHFFFKGEGREKKMFSTLIA